jgi:DNA-binding SARP family transcriptional activator/tetratricopeptide (TPR) repeat protein
LAARAIIAGMRHGRGTGDGDSAVEVKVLGPVGVRRGGDWYAPPTGQLRALLATLALADAEMTAPSLVDAIWRDRGGSARDATVAVAIHRLRRWLANSLDDAARVVRPGSGYRLEVPGGGTDVQRFRQFVARAPAPDADPRGHAAALGRALAVWRGPALDDVPSRYTPDAAVAQLEGERLACTVALGRTLLRLGEPVRAVDLIEGAARRHPLDELVQGLLVEALAAAGRQADALSTYGTVRDRLVEELGIEPGPGLRESYLKVLRQEPAAPAAPAAAGPPDPVPAQLPADVVAFTGRADSLRGLDLHAGRHGGTPAGVSVVVGSAGVGKTALVRHWAHAARGRYPDGQLFVDLRGYADGEPLRPLDVLGTFLRALGVAPERVPPELDEAAAAYRTRLADRRMLIVLDNARSAAQVRPLLPGGSHCHVVVTSRDSLAGLMAVDGARPIRLKPFTSGQSRRLLIELLGERRVREDAPAAEALAEACAHLPLALRIVGADLSLRPDTPLAGKVTALDGGSQLAELALPGDDDAGVAAVFRPSYDALPPVAQRLFRLLGVAPVRDITVPAAAALAGLAVTETRSLVATLADGCLLDEHRTGRYAFHDLLREYAAQLAAAVDSPVERETAITRLLDWYVTGADTADRLLYPHVWRMGPAAGPSGTLDRATALRWLNDELPNLVACARHAAAGEHASHAWRMADATRGYLWHGAHIVEWRTIAEAGRHAAERAGDRHARAAMSQSLAFLSTICHAPDAVDRYRTTLRLARETGWRAGEAMALGNLGRTYNDRGRLARAVDCLEEALAIGAELDDPFRLAADTGNLGIVLADRGQLSRAADMHARALALFRGLGAHTACATALNNLARAHWATGRPDTALPMIREAIALHRDAGARVGEADGLGLLASVTGDLGDTDAALRHARAGLVLIRATGDDRNAAELLNVLGSLHLARHDDEAALDCYRQASHDAEQAVSPLPALQSLVGQAAATHRLGRWADADALVRRALAESGRCGYRLVEGHAWTVLARLEIDGGRPAEARAAAEAALTIRRETGHRLVDADPGPILDRLARLPGSGRSSVLQP